MTEDEAREQVHAAFGKAAVERLNRLVTLVIEEAGRQNLIAGSTVSSIWVRHVLDSTQLLSWAPANGLWLDVGTGGGFPGLAIAAATLRPTILIEPRRKRADFLRHAAEEIGLEKVLIVQQRIEAFAGITASVISARAVAPIEQLVRASRQCADDATRWILPRGASYVADVERARSSLDALFHVEQSVTDPACSIVIVSGLAS